METGPERNDSVAIEDDLDGIAPDVYERRWKVLAVLCASLMIVIIGNTVLNVALPTMADPEQLGASNTELQWIVDAYALVFAGLLFTAGALGDRFGRKGALQIGLLIFGAGSMFGALSDSSSQLIAARAVMGIGAAFVMPSTLSILTNVFPRRERAKAIAIWAGISGAGAAIGPVTSGFLLQHFWWGSVFLVNIPIIVAALASGYLLLPKSKDTTASPLDPFGALLSIVGLSAFVYAIIEGPNHGWTSAESLTWFGASVAVLAVFVWWESTTRHPMLDLRLFGDRRFAVSSGGITLVFFAMFGTFFVLSQYLQFVLGYSPLGAAVRLLPVSVVMMVLAPQTPRLSARFGANVVASVGLTLVAVGLAAMSLFETDSSYIQVIATIVVLAAGMALTMSPMTNQLMSAVPRDRAGIGSAMNDTTREFGGALGVAVLGSIVTSQYAAGVGSAVAGASEQVRNVATSSIAGVENLIAQGAVPADRIDALRAVAGQSFVDGVGAAAMVGAVLVLGAACAVRFLLPSDRDNPDVIGERVGVPAAPSGEGPIVVR
ncbi:MAG: MFS transporter [Ilumatobacteraceae bacterium]